MGEKQSVRAKVVPKGIVTYKTSNKRIVSVSKKGVMKAKAAGRVTITVKANGIKKKLKVIVKQ
ncbi:MAG: Ig-like domain-containing protein [Lachnospiraceae bacterium]|nr:Ig-like domain-containing protein [Lachnospiraceae bacterium]